MSDSSVSKPSEFSERPSDKETTKETPSSRQSRPSSSMELELERFGTSSARQGATLDIFMERQGETLERLEVRLNGLEMQTDKGS